MGYSISILKGIRKHFLSKLRRAGIQTTHDLLTQCASREGRIQVAAYTGISASYLLLLTQQCELLQLNGINKDVFALLRAAGVETVDDLVRTNPEVLSTELQSINKEKHLMPLSPEAFMVETWIDQAKTQATQIEL